MKKIYWLVCIFIFSISWSAFASIPCDWKDLGCRAQYLLPKNPNGSYQTDLDPNGRDYHEWAASQGYVVGHQNVIEFKFRFDEESMNTWKQTSYGFPLALEIDLSEANGGNRLRFDHIEHSFPSEANAVQDTSFLNSANADKNAEGLIVRDSRLLKANTDYYVRFYLKDRLPNDGVVVIPNLQVSVNTHALTFFTGDIGVLLGLDNNPLNYFVLESEVYASGWKVYPDAHEGLRWDNKKASYVTKNFLGTPYGVVYVSSEMKQRLDYFDKVCRQVSPNPIVEQFRNLMTGNITIYKTPSNALGQRYANANCDVGSFTLPSSLNGDGSGLGSTSGTAVSSKPNLVAIDTFVTTGESASTTRLTEEDKTFLGTPIWCQMRTKNSGAANAGAFDSACYVSVGKKFDGWNDAVNLGLTRTKSLAKGATNTEHKGIDIIVYPNWYNVVSKIDPNDAVAETIETDNSYNKDNPFSFQIWGRPNVVVSVSADKASYMLSENVSATASFANTGINPYGKTGYVDWYVDGTLLSEQDRILREHLHPGVFGKTETVNFSAPQSYGVHEIKACFRYAVDDLVEELQPADNCSVNAFSIPDPTPPVVIVAPAASPPTAGNGSLGSTSYTPPTTLPAPLTPAEEEDEMNAVHILLNNI